MIPSPEIIPGISRYQEWERRAGPGMRARYADFMPRDPLFEVRPGDIAVTIPGYRIQQTESNLVTVSARDGQGVAIRGLTAADLASALSLLDGKASVLDLTRATSPRWPLPVWRALLQALLGTAIDLPAVFSALLAVIDRIEIVRFPEQPARALWRNYWENASAVRRHLPEFYRSLDDPGKFLAALARLHVLATMGENSQAFYGGYGLIPTVPGGYREIGVQTAIPETLIRTLEYWSLSLEAGPINKEGEMITPRGQVMSFVHEGGTVAGHPAIGAALFALLDEARSALRAVRDAGASDRARDQLQPLAIFHQIFVNAHPFANINHSIAMNIVNDCLRDLGFGFTPHLFLDYLAQRLPSDRYAAAFARAIELHALPGHDPTGRNRSFAHSAALHSRYRADRDAVASSPV